MSGIFLKACGCMFLFSPSMFPCKTTSVTTRRKDLFFHLQRLPSGHHPWPLCRHFRVKGLGMNSQCGTASLWKAPSSSPDISTILNTSLSPRTHRHWMSRSLLSPAESRSLAFTAMVVILAGFFLSQLCYHTSNTLLTVSFQFLL